MNRFEVVPFNESYCRSWRDSRRVLDSGGCKMTKGCLDLASFSLPTPACAHVKSHILNTSACLFRHFIADLWVKNSVLTFFGYPQFLNYNGVYKTSSVGGENWLTTQSLSHSHTNCSKNGSHLSIKLVKRVSWRAESVREKFFILTKQSSYMGLKHNAI